MSYEYECAASGLTVEGSPHDHVDGEEHGDLPLGWTRLRFTRRQYNPKWVMLQHTKEKMHASLIEQTGATTRMDQITLSLQVEAQMAPLERETARYLPDVDDEVYLSDHPNVIDLINEIRNQLNLDAVPVPEEGDDDDGPEELEVGDTPEEDDEDDGEEA